jgi:hypothetical protein
VAIRRNVSIAPGSSGKTRSCHCEESLVLENADQIIGQHPLSDRPETRSADRPPVARLTILVLRNRAETICRVSMPGGCSLCEARIMRRFLRCGG